MSPTDVLATDPVALMARIRARAEGGIALWWWSGQVLAKPTGGVARSILGITGIGWSRLRRLDDGTWESLMSEAGYYTDPQSGAILEQWTNPLTGRTVRAAHNRLRLRYLIEADGAVRPPVPGAAFEGRIGPALVSGDTVWIGERLAVALPARPGAGAGALSGSPMEYTRFAAKLADLGQDFVPATMAHGTIWEYHPWMEMEGEGQVISDIIGRKLRGPDELPAALRARIDADHPGLLTAPDL